MAMNNADNQTLCPNRGINIIDLAQLTDVLDNPYQPHHNDYFCLIYIEHGQGLHTIDGVAHCYQSHDIIFINRDQFHSFDPNDCPQGTMVKITPAFFSDCSANIRKSYFVPFHMSLTHSPVLNLDSTLNHSCRTILHEMAVAQKDHCADDVYTQLIFSALLLRLAQQRQHSYSAICAEDRNRFNQFLEQVDQQFIHVREAKAYAQLMNLSYKALNQLCKRCCGRTAKQLIDFRLNLEICRKLSMDNDSVQTIAFNLGFDDTTNFVKYFKRFNQITPSKYRSLFHRR